MQQRLGSAAWRARSSGEEPAGASEEGVERAGREWRTLPRRGLVLGLTALTLGPHGLLAAGQFLSGAARGVGWPRRRNGKTLFFACPIVLFLN